MLRRTSDGTPFMKAVHPLGDLAPRDIVARAIDLEMKKSGADHVLLDITDNKADFVRGRFPGIHEECLRRGIDITRLRQNVEASLKKGALSPFKI